MLTIEQIKTFLVDHKRFTQLGADGAIKSFEKEEPGYFDSMISGILWGMDNIDLNNINYDFIDTLHQKLVGHLKLDQRVADGPRNFGLVPDVTCDEAGLKKFVSEQFMGKAFYLDMTVFDKELNPIGRYYFLNGQIQIADPRTIQVREIALCTPEKAYSILEMYFFKARNATVKVNALMSAAETKTKVRDLLRSLTAEIIVLNAVRATLGEVRFQRELDKIVLSHMAQLNQAHSFLDGNARLAFVLTNLIFYKFNLPFIWPSEQSVLEMLGEDNGLSMFEKSRINFTQTYTTKEFVESLRSVGRDPMPKVAALVQMWQKPSSVASTGNEEIPSENKSNGLDK
jgi:hypothetical protein